MRAIALTFLSLVAGPAAGDISLVQPIDCTLDQDCYLQQFVDQDPSTGTRDFACGSLSYDGHKGTDFALPTLAAQAAGVDVLAAATGTVQGIRNDMPDVLQGSVNAPDVSDRECGNGVVIVHADGYETQYCHMKQGSITVRAGDSVSAGDVLGQVGLSGQTEFPHLHLSVRLAGDVVDPFDPDGAITCGIIDNDTLWTTPLPTPPGGIIEQGWSNRVPAFAEVKAGTAAMTGLTSIDALVAWVHLFGTVAGDHLTVALTGPTGDVLRDTVSLDRTQAQSFRALGKRAPSGGWPPGTYTAHFVHMRGDAEIDSVTFTTQLSR